MIKEITNEEKGLVTLLDGFKHNLCDGDEVIFQKVEGMVKKDGDKEVSINDVVHKVTVETPSSFRIGDTTAYSEYKDSGLARQVKSKIKIDFKPLSEITWSNIPFDENLLIADFCKIDH
jgi:hypothetical protein